MTRHTRWTAGTHHGLVWPQGAALLDERLDASVAEAVWERLSNGVDLARFFAVLMEECGCTVLDLPEFAVAFTASDHRQLAVRGEFSAGAPGIGHDQSVTGRGVITWSEARIPVCDDLLLLGRGAQQAGAGRAIVSGVVPAGSLLLGLDAGGDGSASRSDVRSASSSEPVSESAAAQATTYDPPSSTEKPATLVSAEAVHVVDAGAPGTVDPLVGQERETRDRDPLEPTGAPSNEFDELWREHTVLGSVERAAVRPLEAGLARSVPPAPRPTAQPPPEPAAETIDEVTLTGDEADPDRDELPVFLRDALSRSEVTPLGATLGDHDGETVIHARAPLASGAPGRPASGPDGTVLASVCPVGHANPPSRMLCRVCGAALNDVPRLVTRPAVGLLRTSEGATYDLTGPVIVGRDPRAARFQGTEIPQLVSIGQPHVSASHVEITVDGWTVLASDLRSTNGTYLRRPEHAPCRLSESAVPLQDGDVLDLGHGVQLTVEALA